MPRQWSSYPNKSLPIRLPANLGYLSAPVGRRPGPPKIRPNFVRDVVAPVGAAVGAGILGSMFGKKKQVSTSAPALKVYNRKGAMMVKPVKGKVAKLSQQVKALTQQAKADEGTLIYKSRFTTRCISSVARQNMEQTGSFTPSFIETALAQLRYYNPSVPGTLIQADPASSTFSKNFLIDAVHYIRAVNNYQVPAKVTIYACVPKSATSIAPLTAYTNGLADVGNPTSTSPLLHLSDSPQFNELWKIQKTVSKTIMPGQQCMLQMSAKNIKYDTSEFDSETSTYQPRYKSWQYIVRVEGVLGHDTSANEQSLLQAGVDIEHYRKVVVHYDAGINLTWIHIDDSSPTAFTNSGVISSKPVADNIPYSVS